MFELSSSGSFDETERWLREASKNTIFDSLAKYGAQGVSALAAATPKDSGATAAAWSYEVISDATSWSIVWSNSNVNDGRPVAILLQYGHGTGTGGYVPGQDYINPALKPIFDRMVAEGWKVVMGR